MTIGTAHTLESGLCADERARIAAIGPWPLPASFSRDPSDCFFGNSVAIKLGRMLFRDGWQAADGKIACVSCHKTGRVFADEG